MQPLRCATLHAVVVISLLCDDTPTHKLTPLLYHISNVPAYNVRGLHTHHVTYDIDTGGLYESL